MGAMEGYTCSPMINSNRILKCIPLFPHNKLDQLVLDSKQLILVD